jgi:hypothetical protein
MRSEGCVIFLPYSTKITDKLENAAQGKLWGGGQHNPQDVTDTTRKK